MIIMNVKEKILEVIDILDQLEEYDSTLADKLSMSDSKIADLYHIIEMNKLKTNECYRIVQELRKVLCERRQIKDDISLLAIYKSQKEKLQNDKNRLFFKQSIYKKYKEISEPTYNTRVYTDEEIDKILRGEKECNTNTL